MGYEFVEHTADLGVRVFAEDTESLFEEAGKALTEVAGAKSSDESSVLELDLEGLDRVDLLVRWLQELLYLIEAKGFRPGRIEIRGLTETGLKASVHGIYKPAPLTHGIKAVTYHNLEIQQMDGTVQATIIFDV